jgi:hypothetical protein
MSNATRQGFGPDKSKTIVASMSRRKRAACSPASNNRVVLTSGPSLQAQEKGGWPGVLHNKVKPKAFSLSLTEGVLLLLLLLVDEGPTE